MDWLDVLKEAVDGEVIMETVAVSLGLGLSAMFHFFQRSHAITAGRVEKLALLPLDNDLLKRVQDGNEKDFQYVSVCGKVRPDENPLKSRYFPDRKGVILNFVTEEHKEIWATNSNIWYENNRELSNITETVPFSLSDGKDASVHVVNPLKSSWTSQAYDTINKEYRSPNSSVMDSILGLVSGDRLKGYTDTEKMLQVGTQLLGVGELIVENNVLQLRKPVHGEYIITRATHSEVVAQLHSKSNVWKVLALISLGVTVCGIYFVSKRLRKKYSDAKANLITQEEIREVKRRRKSRKITGNASGNNQNEMCVICLSNPRECVILNCGHICACVDCIEMLPDPKTCPICRAALVSIVPLFNS